mmetsp:Transcript_26541/g.52954  ORF Transcript_26541/g.52954 Transcript_26541/m.52954 type:complete len:524 (+) Transcript_26541:229-1800(+)
MRALQASLAEIANDAARHEEVQIVLNSIILDVELAASINSRRLVAKKMASSAAQIEALRDACAEYRVMEEAKEKERKAITDLFLQDLVKLTSKYEKMQEELAEAKEAMKSVSTLSRQLADSERRCRALERRASNTQNANVVVAPVSDQGSTIVALPPDPTPPPPPPPPNKNLKALDDTALFSVFSFLEAFDVLSTAQVDRAFFARVDKLFGIGSAVNMEAPAGAVSTTTAAANNRSRSDSGNGNGEQSAVSTPTRPSKSTPSVATPSPGRQPVAAAANNIISRGLSLLSRPTSNSAKGGNDEAKAKGGEGESSDNGASDTGVHDAANFASSIAEKLSAPELKSIISLIEKLKKNEREIMRVTAEREDLAVRLEGSENVKEFLTKKVKDMEGAAESAELDAALVAQQTSADQEVISFLDARVRELEKGNEELEEKTAKAESGLNKFKEERKKQLKVLEDMLQFERQNLKSKESEFKSAKKLLVKEVKVGRAQIVTLLAERDSLKGELESLREAFQSGSRRSSLS